MVVDIDSKKATRDVLNMAGELITEKTWVQGTMFLNGREQFCAIGAIELAAEKVAGRWGSQSDYWNWASNILADYIQTEECTYQPEFEPNENNAQEWISGWNDHHADHANTVSEALHRAAEMIDIPEEKEKK